MNESIKKLLDLQKHDLQLDQLRSELAKIPAAIAAIQKQIADARIALEGAKKDVVQFQLQRKEREIDLEQRETAVRKHTGELNAVKSNDAYKALLGEIEKAKRDKSTLEDQILQIMESLDGANRIFKEKENAAKSTEGERQRQITEWETKAKAIEGRVAEEVSARETYAGTLPQPLLATYERLRNAKRGGAAIVPLRGEQCSGCHLKVSPNFVNELRRGQQMMSCESCSRIVYIEEEVPAA